MSRFVSRAFRVLWVLLVAVSTLVWLVSRVLTDRFAWSQPLWWVPAPVLLFPVWLAGAAAVSRLWRGRATLRRAGRASRSRQTRPCRQRVWRVCVFAAALGSGVYLGVVETGAPRAISQAFVGTASRKDAVRLVFWNQAGREADDISAVFLPLDPTLFVLANRHTGTRTRDLAQAFIDTGEAHAAVGWPFDLFSRVPIRRWASTSLGLEGASRTAEGSSAPDPGWAAWFEVETPERVLVVWAIDLPSDPDLARYSLAQQAGKAIAAWRGMVRVIEADGRRTEQAESEGFPAPDLIVGDFNIPRHSASLGAFLRSAGTGRMRDAFDVAGIGWQRTWPREHPVWAIDQCLVGPRVTPFRYTSFDPGTGGHRAVVVEFGIDRPPATDRAR